MIIREKMTRLDTTREKGLGIDSQSVSQRVTVFDTRAAQWCPVGVTGPGH